jgi:hypothetical protein
MLWPYGYQCSIGKEKVIFLGESVSFSNFPDRVIAELDVGISKFSLIIIKNKISKKKKDKQTNKQINIQTCNLTYISRRKCQKRPRIN